MYLGGDNTKLNYKSDIQKIKFYIGSEIRLDRIG